MIFAEVTLDVGSVLLGLAGLLGGIAGLGGLRANRATQRAAAEASRASARREDVEQIFLETDFYADQTLYARALAERAMWLNEDCEARYTELARSLGVPPLGVRRPPYNPLLDDLRRRPSPPPPPRRPRDDDAPASPS